MTRYAATAVLAGVLAAIEPPLHRPRHLATLLGALGQLEVTSVVLVTAAGKPPHAKP